MSLSPATASRAAGLLAGLCLVGIVALQAWRVPASARPAAVAVDLRAVPSGEVGVTPAGPLLDRRDVMPGGAAARGRVRLSNRTAQGVSVRPTVTGGDPALDRLVELELTAEGRVLYRGPLGGLRAGGRASLAISRTRAVAVGVAARVPASAAAEAAARSGRWSLTFAVAGAGR
ncbi:MAG TPA: hypothetical protein VHF89_05605 [Solirubrobacteraceae bacterium]|nr:hypothetical protein [Solirubrobacteraceae bacterium]